MRNLIYVALFAQLPVAAMAQAKADTIPTDTLKEQTLGEVTVTSKRKLVKNDIDKLTYDVVHDEDSKSNSVLEMLKKVPLVTVDGQDNIMVNGSTSFKIYKNGHPDPTFSGSNAKDVFRGLPASSIKKIEVITDPGAKYDAEGTTAILNIVMNDDASLVGVAGWTSATVDNNGYVSPNFGITAQKGKWTVSNELGYGYQPERMNYSDDISETYFPKIGQRRHVEDEQHTHINVLYDSPSASYEIDSLNLLSMSASMVYYTLGATHELYNYTTTDDAGNLLSRYRRERTFPKYNYLSGSGRVDFQHKTHLDGEVLTLSYMISAMRNHQRENDFLTFPDEEHRPNLGYDCFSSRNNEDFLENTFQIDYVRPLWKGHKIETGAKYINRSNKSRAEQNYFGEGNVPDSTSSDFNHLTQVAAFYLQYIYSGKHWSARAGLRYEYSYLRAKFKDGSQPDFHTNLNDWCPSASVMYRIDDENSLKLEYYTGINRPGISYLNPMRFETGTDIYIGNPDLSSNRGHHIGLAYTHMSQKLSFQIMPYYNFTGDQIGEVNSAVDDKVLQTYGNVISGRRFAVNYYAQWQITKTTNLYVQGETWHRYLRNKSLRMKLDGWGGSYYGFLSQDLPKKFRVTASAGGAYGRWPADVYSLSGKYFFYRLTLQKKFLNDKLVAQIGWSNPFIHRNASMSRVIQGDYTGFNNSHSRAQSVSLTISWNFGKLKAQVKKADTTIQNDDVVGGVKK